MMPAYRTAVVFTKRQSGGEKIPEETDNGCRRFCRAFIRVQPRQNTAV